MNMSLARKRRKQMVDLPIRVSTRPTLIKRFVDRGDLPPGQVSDFDPVKNILRISRQFYDNCRPALQRELWRTIGSMAFEYHKTGHRLVAR